MDTSAFVKLSYLVAAALFILGLKNMAHPRTAVRGNMLGAAGMFLAVIVTLMTVDQFGFIAVAALVGAVIGLVLAQRIPMTEMPQLVALCNGFGGIASTLVAGAEFLRMKAETPDVLIATAVSAVIGTVTFWGSFVAFGKLQGLKAFSKNWAFPGQQAINALLLLTMRREKTKGI